MMFYPATPVDCLLSSLGELEVFPNMSAEDIRAHVLAALAEANTALTNEMVDLPPLLVEAARR